MLNTWIYLNEVSLCWKEHVYTRKVWASRLAAPVCGGEGGSWDNHFLSGQSGRLSAAAAHGSLGFRLPSCFALVSALGFPPQRGVEQRGMGVWKKERRGGWWDGGEGRGVHKERSGERERMWPEPWVLAKSPPSVPLHLPLYPTPPRLPLATQWLLLCWNFTLLDPEPGVLSSHNVQAAEHVAGKTHSAS